MVTAAIRRNAPKKKSAKVNTDKSQGRRAATREVETIPDQLGWATFNRNGGAVIEEVDESGVGRVIGTTATRPQVRIRPVWSFPKSAARVRKEHTLLFDDYKSIHRQVRTLVAMGIPFVIRSGGHRALVDRHPNFAHDLIDREIGRQKQSAVGDLAKALLIILKSLRKKSSGRPEELEPTAPVLIDEVSDEQAAPGPYEQLRLLAKKFKPMLEKELYDGITHFLDDRRDRSQEADITRRTANDLPRNEVD